MKARTITTCGVITSVIGLLVLEFWTLVNKQKEDTISEVVNSASKEYLLIPFSLGMLMGHWFWSMKGARGKK